MDISNYTSLPTTTAKMEVEDHVGEPVLYKTGNTVTNEDDEDVPEMAQATISLVCSDSSEYQAVYKQQITDNAAKLVKRKGKKSGITGDSVDEDKLDLLVACTKAWIGFENNGKPLAYSKQNARMLYTRLFFIRDQVDDFIHDRGNFLTGAS